MYIGYKEARKVIGSGGKVNFHHRGKEVVLDKNSTINDLYKVYGYFGVTVHSIVNGKFIAI